MNEYVIFVHYLLFQIFIHSIFISLNFYVFYFPGAATEPLGSARGTLRAPRSTGWEPLLYYILDDHLCNEL